MTNIRRFISTTSRVVVVIAQLVPIAPKCGLRVSLQSAESRRWMTVFSPLKKWGRTSRAKEQAARYRPSWWMCLICLSIQFRLGGDESFPFFKKKKKSSSRWNTKPSMEEPRPPPGQADLVRMRKPFARVAPRQILLKSFVSARWKVGAVSSNFRWNRRWNFRSRAATTDSRSDCIWKYKRSRYVAAFFSIQIIETRQLKLRVNDR